MPTLDDMILYFRQRPHAALEYDKKSKRLTISWSALGVGFGQLMFKLEDDEYMSGEFIEQVINHLNKGSLDLGGVNVNKTTS